VLGFYVTENASLMAASLSGELLAGMRPAWTRIGAEAVRSIHTNFEVGGRPPWTPLSPQTIAEKGHSRPLIRSGRLMESTTYRLTGMGVELENPTPYGPLHQEGRGRVPARPWFVLQPEDELNFTAILDSHIQSVALMF
jgi:phage gpG-like protein